VPERAPLKAAVARKLQLRPIRAGHTPCTAGSVAGRQPAKCEVAHTSPPICPSKNPAAREFDARAAGEHLGGHLADGARHKGIVDLAGIDLGVGDQFGRRARRQRRMHRQHARLRTDQPDWGEILARIVAGIGIERRIDTVR
jgi:hypothetical protein